MLAIDYAWQHPDPHAIAHAGYRGVLRYLSNDASKNLTADEVKALHGAGLWVTVVWEATANRAGQGEKAGKADRVKAERMARRLGYPKSCPIFYAVDFDADPHTVRPYFAGIRAGATHPVGAYGSRRVVDDLLVTSKHAHYGWQTVAWSGGIISTRAHVYQRGQATRTITGARGGFDEDVVMHPLPVWGPRVPVKHAPVKPQPQPQPHPANPDHDLVTAFDKWVSSKGLTR